MRNILLILIWLVATACSLEDPKKSGGIKIILEESQTNLLSRFQSALSLSVASPSTAADFNCFTVNITGPGVGPNNRFGAGCTISNDPAGGAGLGALAAPKTRNTPIEIDIPAGVSRRIDVYGISPPISECLGGAQSAGNSLGYFLGSKTVTILEPTTIGIPISYQGAAGNISCSNSSPSTTVSTVAQEFGNGADGAATVSVSISDASVDTATIGRILSASKRINNIDTGTGTVLTLSGAVTPSQFTVGDEVMWYVNGSSNGLATNCSSASELWPGRFGFARLTAVNTGSGILTLDRAVVSTPGAILNTNMAATPPTTFCSMQVIRVPNLDSLTMSGAAVTTIAPPAFSYSTMNGGILVLRVKNALSSSCSTSCQITADGKGFETGGTSAYQGNGIFGPSLGGSLTAANGNGGGAGSTGGGGGGAHMGAGGAGGVGGNGGSATSCFGSGCLFMGGGGGGATASGTTGGGIAWLSAKTMTVSLGTFFVRADAANAGGAANGAGGGAGGSVVLRTQSALSAGDSVRANGGSGGSGTNSGGGGGGGKVDAILCGATGPTATVLGGSAGGAGAISGTNGSEVVELSNAKSFCP